MIEKSLRLHLDRLALLLVVIIAVLMRQSAGTDPDILSYEFAGNAMNVENLFTDWGQKGMLRTRLGLILDFPFLLAYSLGLFLLCHRIGRRKKAPYLVAYLAVPVAGLQLLAGVLDGLENGCLLWQLHHGPDDALAGAARWLATFKFLFVGLGILYILAGLLARRSSS